MEIKKDIASRKDIESFISNFYENVKTDETIGIIFTSVVKMNWEHHIPLITDFWETILLDNPVYKSNAMAVHFKLNEIYPLKKVHFDAWVKNFENTINEMFEGPVTELAKKRAKGIADLMLFKMTNNATI